MSEVGRQTVQYPGGLAARYRWGGSGSGPEVFGLSESGGTLTDHGHARLGRPRAALPSGAARRGAARHMDGAIRLADLRRSPKGCSGIRRRCWRSATASSRTPSRSRTGELRWTHRSGTPLVALLGSSRLPHLLLQSEVETFALDAEGAVRWRAAHSDVVSAAELVGRQAGAHDVRRRGRRARPADRCRPSGVRGRPVDRWWIERCIATTPSSGRALTPLRQGSYRRSRPEGAREPTNGHDRITAHVAWRVPSGRSVSPPIGRAA